MDPLHPIVPIGPNIPPITPAPMAGRVDRDRSRAGTGQDKRRRRRAQEESRAPLAGSEGLDYLVDDADGEDDSGLHINVTA
jgi:hypothetical protein